ncbi:MAG TPA: 50S ribosomal protein L35 [Vicinamibacteria bacterium]
MKLKSHRGATKRMRRTASGKIKRSHAYAGHILTKKTRRRKRRLRKSALVTKGDGRKLLARLPR